MQERTPDEVLALIADEGIEVVDVRFCDLPGLMQHFSIPASQLTPEVFEEGLGFDDGTRFFRFLDTQGNMHRTLPPDIPFSVTVEPTGSIIWPDIDHYIGPKQVPEGWSAHAIRQLDDMPLYIVTIQKGKTQRQGVWNVDTQQWHIAPDYYSVAPLDSDFEQWAFQPDNKDDLWGIIDTHGDVKVPPRYRSISPDSYVQLPTDDGRNLSFYLHLPSLRELRAH